MVIDFYNRGNGGSSSGGTADYATSAGTAGYASSADTSNSTKLLEGEASFPSNANNGDVVAIGPSLSKGGTKSPAPTLGVYQYDGSSWNKVEGETPDFNILKSVSSFPQDASAGDVVALLQQSRSFSQDQIGVYQYDGSAWNQIGNGGGSSYITDLQPLGINILEGQGVGYASDDDGEGHIIMYTTIEPFNDGSAYVYNYTDDGEGGWMQSESYQLLRPEDIKNEQDDIVASGIIDSNDRVLKVDPDSDGTTQVGGYEPGVGDEPTFTRERYLVSSINISKMVKITQTDYASLVSNDEVDEDTFYVVVPDPEPEP